MLSGAITWAERRKWNRKATARSLGFLGSHVAGASAAGQVQRPILKSTAVGGEVKKINPCFQINQSGQVSGASQVITSNLGFQSNHGGGASVRSEVILVSKASLWAW